MAPVERVHWEVKLKTFLVGGLWLARLDTFNDRLEGTIPRRNLGLMEKLLGSEELAGSVEEDFRFAAQNAYASCWHMSDGDPSEEAWTQFGEQHGGIALRTNPVSLRNQLSELVRIDGPGYISKVNYIDHVSDFIQEAQTLEACFAVQNGFAHEREARVLVNTFGTPAFDLLRLLDNAWGAPLVEEYRTKTRRGLITALKGSIPAAAGEIHRMNGKALVPRINFNATVDEIVVGYRMSVANETRLVESLRSAGFTGVIRRESQMSVH